MIWAKEETLPRDEIEKIQLERLKETVSYIYERVEPYRRKMDEANVKPDDIQSLDDLKKMPFTYKADFRENYPTGLFAVEKKDLVRFHASSGTTGKPTVVGYTKKDLDNWLNNVARIASVSYTHLDVYKRQDMHIVQEMYARGYEFLPIDIYKAKATKFQIIDGKLMPPFSSIDGMGENCLLYTSRCV